MAEPGAATRALLVLAHGAIDDRVAAEGKFDDRALARGICTACVSALGMDGAAISLLTASPSRQTLWATDAVAQRLEDLQFSLNEGVCMEAAATGRAVFVSDLSTSRQAARWPMFAAAVLEQTDAMAVFAVPLQWGAVNLGVMDMYRRVPGGLSAAQHRDVFSATDTAALLMLGLRTDPGSSDWLEPTIGGRAEIHQATGMVLAQLGIDATDALARLRAHAFVEQQLLIDVARDVVAGRLSFTTEWTSS